MLPHAGEIERRYGKADPRKLRKLSAADRFEEASALRAPNSWF
jgi:hypothetical protein